MHLRGTVTFGSRPGGGGSTRAATDPWRTTAPRSATAPLGAARLARPAAVRRVHVSRRRWAVAGRRRARRRRTRTNAPRGPRTREPNRPPQQQRTAATACYAAPAAWRRRVAAQPLCPCLKSWAALAAALSVRSRGAGATRSRTIRAAAARARVRSCGLPTASLRCAAAIDRCGRLPRRRDAVADDSCGGRGGEWCARACPQRFEQRQGRAARVADDPCGGRGGDARARGPQC